MAKFSVNTHHAYLNNDIVLYSDEPVQVVDDQSGDLFKISGQTTNHLAAGKHILSSEDHDEEIIIDHTDCSVHHAGYVCPVRAAAAW